MANETKYDEQAEVLLKEMIAYCYEISTQTNADAFFDYIPHIRAISVRIYPDGWSAKSDAEYIEYEGHREVYFNNDIYGIEALEYIVRELDKLYRRYKYKMQEVEQ